MIPPAATTAVRWDGVGKGLGVPSGVRTKPGGDGAEPGAPGPAAGPAALDSPPVVLYPDVSGPLGSLAALAGTSFASDDEATAAILREVARQLGMRTSFLTRIERGENRVVAAHDEPGGSGITAGTTWPLAHTY